MPRESQFPFPFLISFLRYFLLFICIHFTMSKCSPDPSLKILFLSPSHTCIHQSTMWLLEVSLICMTACFFMRTHVNNLRCLWRYYQIWSVYNLINVFSKNLKLVGEWFPENRPKLSTSHSESLCMNLLKGMCLPVDIPPSFQLPLDVPPSQCWNAIILSVLPGGLCSVNV